MPALYVFAVLTVIDLVTTYIGLGIGATEGNPIMGAIPMGLWVPARVGQVVLLWRMQASKSRSFAVGARIGLWAGIVLQTIVCAHNLLVLSQ